MQVAGDAAALVHERERLPVGPASRELEGDRGLRCEVRGEVDILVGEPGGTDGPSHSEDHGGAVCTEHRHDHRRTPRDEFVPEFDGVAAGLQRLPTVEDTAGEGASLRMNGAGEFVGVLAARYLDAHHGVADR